MKKIMSLMVVLMLASWNVLPANKAVKEEKLFGISQSNVCIVADPTGTPLNVRAKPRTGKVLTKLKNGIVVRVEEIWAEPGTGDETSEWAKISITKKGKRQILGWVLHYYLNCN